MTTWAAKLACVKAGPQKKATAETDSDYTIAVIDANALISLGEQTRTLADVVVTTDEVVAEIRDAASRAAVERLSLARRAPTDEGVRAVASFATRTGDIHQLSSEDVRLLALAYTYEVDLYGDQHLRRFPVIVRAHARRASAAPMPGWGNTCNNEEWAAIDQTPDTNESASVTRSRSATLTYGNSRLVEQVNEADMSWEVAKRSKNAARRAKRKAEMRAKAAAAECEAHHDTHPADSVLQNCTDDDRPHSDGVAGVNSDDDASLNSDYEAEAINMTSLEPSELDSSLGMVQNSSTSRVSLVTSDFPMQNVAIQMGLRLQSKGGRSITTIQRSVLRCDACSQVVKSQSKMFCPACGHATLSRVAVTVGPGGAEHYGVRKRHTLKGTRFSLPKPRGGKGSAAPILSEDVYNSKVHKPKAKPADDPLQELTLGEHKKYSAHSRGVSKGLSYLVTGPGNNPNERKNMPRSNRRR